jgi:hypothetical protein
VFLPDSPLPSGLPSAALGTARRLAATMFARPARKVRPAGSALDLIPPATPAPDLVWASGTPRILDAFARSISVIDAVGERDVPASVRELLAQQLAIWDGSARGLGREWVDDATAGLPRDDRAAGRLALLTAFASYQVRPGDLEAVRAEAPTDGALLGLVSWASMSAARRIGTWLDSDRNQEVLPIEIG